MDIFKTRSAALCRLQTYAAWQLRTLKFLGKLQDPMIANAA
jgi:hypothetical protein